MKPVSEEVREIIVKHSENGKTAEEIVELVFRSISTIYKVLALFERTGSVKPKPYGGNHRKITVEQESLILELINEKRDITLLQIIEELCLNITESGLSRWLARHDLTYKKRRSIQMDRRERMLLKNAKNGAKRSQN